MLRGWAESVARFREDANAEDDAARVGYRDRLLVELLQNAHDAAGSGGRVLVRLVGRELRVANTGAPLTADGLVALSTLRASAKRDSSSLGRFGAGFSAVLAVSDEPSIASGGACVGWSAARTREVLPSSLHEEVRRRDGQVPVLRLPFALPWEPPPDGYDTEVRLPLREGVPAASLLEEFRPELLLVFDALDRVELDADGAHRVVVAERGDGVVEVGGVRWLGAAAAATHVGAGDGPEGRRGPLRAAAWWPEGGWPGSVPQVFFAPTPTDEPTTLPVLVVADLPVDAHRRRTVPGPLRDAALDVAADAIAALAPRLPGQAVLGLLPATLPAGPLDTRLRDAVVERLQERWPLPGRRVLDVGAATPAVAAFLADGVVGDLLPPAWPATSGALRQLGVERLESAAVVELVADFGARQPAAWWRRAWDVLAELPDAQALSALPVPLLGGGLAPGPRGLLQVDEPPEGLADRLRIVDPAGAHPAQLRRGAVEAGPRELLDALRPAVESSYDDGDLELAELVLPLVSEPLPWLGDLALRDRDGEVAPAGELVLAGSPLDRALRDDAPLGVVDDAYVDRFGPEALRRCGVGDALVTTTDLDDLDKGEEFLAVAGEEPLGVRDLDWLRWPEGLQLLEDLPGAAWDYVRFWAAGEPLLDGLTPGEVLGPGADPLLAGLYDSGAAPDAVLAGLGCRTSLPEEAAEVLDLLDRLGDPSREVGRAQLRELLRWVAGVPGLPAEPPFSVRAVAPDGALVCVPPGEAVLVDSPDLLPLLGNRPLLPVPPAAAAALSRLLGVPLASSLGDFAVVAEDPLTCLDADGVPTRVRWRGSRWDGPEGEGRARAWLEGRWERRHAYVAALRGDADPREDDLDP